MLLGLVAPALADDAPAPKHKETQSDSFIMIEPMYTTVVDSGRPDGMLLVAIGLDIPDPTLRAQANLGMPVLRDAYVRSLMSYTAAVVRPDHQPDVTLIADRLQRVTDRELHRKGARVLLAQVALQPKPN
jgi:flagellar basal body-associated protein FliL